MAEDLTSVLTDIKTGIGKQTDATNRMAQAAEALAAAAPGTTTLPTDPGGAMPNVMQDTRTGKLGEVSLSEATINALIKGIAAGATVSMMGGMPTGGVGGFAKSGAKFLAGMADRSEALNKASAEFAKFRQEILASDFKFDDINKGLVSSKASLDKLNISTDQVIKAMTALRSGSTAVRSELLKNSEQGNKNVVMLAAMAAKYEKMGVPVDTFASSINTAKESLGLFSKSGEVNTKDLDKLMGAALGVSKAYKISLGDAIKQLTQSSTQLTIMGIEPLTRNFSQLQNMAVNTGVSFESLMKTSERFNTLEGAADVVGNLSAVLKGTTISVGEMLSAEPAERVKAVLGDIRGAIEEGRFELAEGGMDRVYQIQALAQAAGTTEEEMNKLLRNQTDIDALFEDRAGKIKMSTDEAADATANMLSAEEKKASVITTLNNAVVTGKDNFKDFSKIVNDNTAVMRDNIRNFGESLQGISSIIAGVKTSVQALSPEGATEGSGLLGTLLFGRKEVLQTNMNAVEGALRQLDDMYKKLAEGFETVNQMNTTATADPTQAPSNFTPSSNQRASVSPNGDVKVEVVLPAPILGAAVNRHQTNQLHGK